MWIVAEISGEVVSNEWVSSKMAIFASFGPRLYNVSNIIVIVINLCKHSLLICQTLRFAIRFDLLNESVRIDSVSRRTVRFEHFLLETVCKLCQLWVWLSVLSLCWHCTLSISQNRRHWSFLSIVSVSFILLSIFQSVFYCMVFAVVKLSGYTVSRYWAEYLTLCQCTQYKR